MTLQEKLALLGVARNASRDLSASSVFITDLGASRRCSEWGIWGGGRQGVAGSTQDRGA